MIPRLSHLLQISKKRETRTQVPQGRVQLEVMWTSLDWFLFCLLLTSYLPLPPLVMCNPGVPVDWQSRSHVVNSQRWADSTVTSLCLCFSMPGVISSQQNDSVYVRRTCFRCRGRDKERSGREKGRCKFRQLNFSCKYSIQSLKSLTCFLFALLLISYLSICCVHVFRLQFPFINIG